MTYTCTTVISQEGKWYVARCVELGVISQGKSIEQAQTNLREAVELYLDDQPRHRKLLSRKSPLVTTMQIKHA